MKKIKLTNKDLYVLVDDEDYKKLKKHNWYFKPGHSTVYCDAKIDGKFIAMHRYIMGLKTGDRLDIDHLDGNGLNNQKDNLRVCTRSQNLFNSKMYKTNSTGYRGVYRYKKTGRIYSLIMVNRKNIYLGLFNTLEEAAEAYNKAALKYAGEFASLNDV